MKTYRRIEITAFRRRVQIISGELKSDDAEICINDADSRQAIDTESDEGRRILAEAVRLLNEKLDDADNQS